MRALPLALALATLCGFRQNAAAQGGPPDAAPDAAPSPPPAVALGRHHVAVYLPDLTFLNTPDRTGIGYARVTSASLHYQYFLAPELFYVGGFAGPAMTHPRLETVAGRWSGAEFGVTTGVGIAAGPYVWLGAQVRASLTRSPFRLDGYVPSADGTFFAPAPDVRGALRQDNLETAALLRGYFGESGAYLSLEASLLTYRRGVFSEADLYPGFEREGVLLIPLVTRLPQNEYRGGVALRGRIGVGFTW